VVKVYDTPVVPFEGPLGIVGTEIASAIAEKVAVTALFPFIVKVAGLELPVRSPLQLLKVYPEFAVAVRLTCSP
jgi:hypothetical protein